MRDFKVRKGNRISFTYDDPKDGTPNREGVVDRVKRTRKQNLITFTIFDETVNQYRSFHYRKMRNIKVGV